MEKKKVKNLLLNWSILLGTQILLRLLRKELVSHLKATKLHEKHCADLRQDFEAECWIKKKSSSEQQQKCCFSTVLNNVCLVLFWCYKGTEHFLWIKSAPTLEGISLILLFIRLSRKGYHTAKMNRLKSKDMILFQCPGYFSSGHSV